MPDYLNNVVMKFVAVHDAVSNVVVDVYIFA